MTNKDLEITKKLLSKGRNLGGTIYNKREELYNRNILSGDLEEAFKRVKKFKSHNLNPEDLEKMEDEIYD